MEKKKHSFNSYFAEDEAGINISWGAIFAGVITFLSVFMTLSLIGTAIGFGKLNLTSNNPLEGVGTGVIIWLVIMLIISFISAGFISGVAAKRIGLLHGFLTWATSMITVIAIISFTTVSAFSAIGSLIGDVASDVGDGLEAVTSTAGNAISKGFDNLSDQIETVDTQDLQYNINKYLKDTNVPELQPDYLNDQLEDASDTIKNAGKEIITNPDDSDKIFDETSDSLQKQVEKIKNSVDKNAIANAVSKNTDLSQEESKKVTDNIYNGFMTASDQTQKQINTLRDNLEKEKDNLKDSIEEAKKSANEAAHDTAKASIWGFVAMVIGIVITSWAGLLGANLVKNPNREIKM